MTDVRYLWERPASQGMPRPARTDQRASTFHASLPGFARTPLIELPDLARELGVARFLVKDEGQRLGVGSFKILGTTWATTQSLARTLDSEDIEEFGELAALVSEQPITLVAASDGNHGLALAYTAKLLGLTAHVFVPQFLPSSVTERIRNEGADVTVFHGSYDETVQAAAAYAESNDLYILIQDTAWPGYEDIPGWVVEGYSTIFIEADQQLSEVGVGQVDSLFVPVGVGSLAQSAVMHYSGPDTRFPAIVGVEPRTAAGVLESLIAGYPVTVPTLPTVMNGLNCGTPSSLAWPYLRDGLAASIAIGDEVAQAAVAKLAECGIHAGPTGAAGLGGLMELRFGGLGPAGGVPLDDRSVVLVLVTERALI